MSKGFTLIELLVVVTIIGILAASVLVAINPTKRAGQARDAVRKTNLAQIQNALQEYFALNGRYPDSIPGGSGCWSNWEAGSTLNGPNPQFLQVLVNQGALKRVPVEVRPIINGWPSFPGWSECSYRYMRIVNPCSTGKTYAVLYTFLETDSGLGDTRPSGFDGCWGESDPATPALNKYDWGIFMEE